MRLAAGLALAILTVPTIVACDAAASPSPSSTSRSSGETPRSSAEATGTAATDPVVAAAGGAWRPAPYPIGARRDVVEPAVAACRASAPDLADADPALMDVRGEGRVVLLFADDATTVACLATVDDRAPAITELLTPPDAPLADAGIDVQVYRSAETEDGGVLTWAVGRVGRAGMTVSASFDDESYVDATKAAGWWAMWWPTEVDAATINALDRQSISIAAVVPER
jgi:hypothetical protein